MRSFIVFSLGLLILGACVSAQEDFDDGGFDLGESFGGGDGSFDHGGDFGGDDGGFDHGGDFGGDVAFEQASDFGSGRAGAAAGGNNFGAGQHAGFSSLGNFGQDEFTLPRGQTKRNGNFPGHSFSERQGFEGFGHDGDSSFGLGFGHGGSQGNNQAVEGTTFGFGGHDGGHGGQVGVQHGNAAGFDHGGQEHGPLFGAFQGAGSFDGLGGRVDFGGSGHGGHTSSVHGGHGGFIQGAHDDFGGFDDFGEGVVHGGSGRGEHGFSNQGGFGFGGLGGNDQGGHGGSHAPGGHLAFEQHDQGAHFQGESPSHGFLIPAGGRQSAASADTSFVLGSFGETGKKQ